MPEGTLKLLQYPEHASSWGIVCTPEAFELMKKHPEVSGKPGDPINQKLVALHEQLAKDIQAQLDDPNHAGAMSELRKHNFDIKPRTEPVIGPDEFGDGWGPYGVMLAPEEYCGWELDAILCFMESELDIEIERINYYSSQDPEGKHDIWGEFVQD